MKERPKRPFFVTCLALVVLIIAALHLVRLTQVISEWKFLSELPNVSPAYLAASGLAWVLLGLLLAWGLWRGSGWAPLAARFLSLTYALYRWIERLIMARFGDPQSDWPFALAVTLVSLFIIYWGLSRPPVRAFFIERRETGPKEV